MKSIGKGFVRILGLILVGGMMWVMGGLIGFWPGPWELGSASGNSSEVDDNTPPVPKAVEPDPIIPDSAPVSWDCFYDPTMNRNWHDDVYCTNGVQSERPILLPGQFVTEADMRAAGEEYEAALNQSEPDAGGPPETVGGGIPARPSEAVSMTVEHVHDGDTLLLRTDQPNALVTTTDAVKVRLLGIDTPEVGDRAECFGDQATEQLRTLLPDGSRTWITADKDPVDRYGRSLFYLWTEDGRFVNYELVAGGAAESLMFAPNDAHYPLLRAAEDAATTAGAGMWGAC